MCFFLFFKQKTAYEMRIRDWSSDVCSSDLQDVLMEVWERTHVTAVCVTHDVDEAILLADRVVMMTNGPNARIGEILEVDLPRPRDRRALLDHPKFYEYRQKVLRFLAE